MIRYREKIFVLPLVPLLVEGGLTAATVVSGAKDAAKQKEAIEAQTKEQKKMARLQRESDEKMAEALEKLSTKNPAAGAQAAEMMKQRSYTFVRNLGKFTKDVGSIVAKNKVALTGMALTGAAMGTTGYVVDKAIQKDMKKNKIPLPERPQERTYTLGSVLKETGKTITSAAKRNKKSALLLSGMVAVPTVMGYQADKKAYKQQIDQTEQAQQKQYSKAAASLFQGLGKTISGNASKLGKNVVGSVRKTGKSISSGWKTFKSHPMESTLGGISNMTGGGGKDGIKNVADDFKELGKKNNSPWSTNVGNFMDKHKKTALAASVPVGLGIMAGTWDAGQKAVEKTARKVDKNAFRYQDSQNQQIQ